MSKKTDCFVATLSRAPQPIILPVLKFGGLPVFVASLELPICRGCGEPMDFLAQIPLDSPLRLSDRYKLAYVFMCSAQNDVYRPRGCETWEAWSGANAVFFQENRGIILIPHAEPRYPDYLATLSPREEPDVDVRAKNVSEELAAQVSDSTKIGGSPRWVQYDDTPICKICGKRMSFIAQIAAELDGSLPADPSQWNNYNFFDFGDAGIGYVFMCHYCPGSGAFLWQTY